MDFNDDDDNPLFPGLMMADSQISDLDLSPRKPQPRNGTGNRNGQNAARYFRRSSSRRGAPTRQTGLEDMSSEPLPFAMSPDPDPAGPAPASRPHAQRGVNYDDIGYDSWEDDIDILPQANTRAKRSTAGTSYSSSNYYSASPPSSPPPPLPSLSPNRNGSQRRQHQQQPQSQPRSTALAAAHHLLQAAKFGVAASGRLVTVARENQHLAVEAGHRLDAYVLQPCLRAGADLARVYCPEAARALRDAEARLRRSVGVGGGGRGGHSGGGGAAKWTSEKEVLKLKDRVVEQDALLREWNQHVRRLIRERDGLKRRLSQNLSQSHGHEAEPASATTTTTFAHGTSVPVSMPHPEISRSPAHYGDPADAGMGVGIGEYEDGAGTPGEIQSDAKAGAFRPPATQQQQQQLVEQLRQLHVLVDQLIVHEDLDPDYDGNGGDHDLATDPDGRAGAGAGGGRSERDKKSFLSPGESGEEEEDDWELL